MLSETTHRANGTPPLTRQPMEAAIMATERLFQFKGIAKVCNKCGISKPRTEFNKERGKERRYCKECHKASVRVWVANNKEKRKKYAREWAADNTKKRKASGLPAPKYNHSPETLAKKSLYSRAKHLGKKYGLTPETWQDMFDAQSGVCKLCKIPGRTGKHGKLSVDHCHVTGRVRGLLCTPCNISIGMLGETPEQWERVWKYLRCEPI